MAKYDVEITPEGVNLLKVESVLCEVDGKEEVKEVKRIVSATPKEVYEKKFGVYEPFPKDEAIKYVGSLSKIELVTGARVRNNVITPLAVCRKEYLKLLKSETGGFDSRYIELNGVPIQKGIICGLVVDADCKITKDGEYFTILHIFDGTGRRRISGYKVEIDPEDYIGMIVRCFVKFKKGEYVNQEGTLVETINLVIEQAPVIVQPKEYVLHKKFIDEYWDKILKELNPQAVVEECFDEFKTDNEEVLDSEPFHEGGEECPQLEEVMDIIQNFLQFDNEVGIGDIMTCYDVNEELIIKACKKLGVHYDLESGMIKKVLKDE